MIKQLPPRSTLTWATLALLSACSATPVVPSSLVQARTALEEAQAQPEVVRLASDELQRAGDALRQAEQAQTRDAGADTVGHLAYLARQRVTLAVDSASSRSGQAAVRNAAAERDREQLGRRTAEADAAGAALGQARQNQATQQARISEMDSQLRALRAQPTDRGMVVTLGDMRFATNQATLSADGEHSLSQLADFMKRFPQRRVVIEGHADSQGSSELNQRLSERRAQTVNNALLSLGVAADRLSATAVGETHPVATNATAEGRRMNRRVEVIFVPEDVTTNPPAPRS